MDDTDRKKGPPPNKTKPSKPYEPVTDAEAPPMEQTPELKAHSHLGDQFVTVYHSSYYPTPPHRMAPPKEFDDYENTTPDHFHVGSIKSATERVIDGSPDSGPREYMHVYRVNAAKAHPVVYGDDPDLHWKGARRDLHIAMKRKNILQPGLFEDVPLTSEILNESKSAVAYRNSGEDKGSISYAIPKQIVAHKDHDPSDSVQYLGMSRILPTPQGSIRVRKLPIA